MTTIHINQNQSLEGAAQAVTEGKLVVFPTETVYGLGAHALDNTAVASIFTAKNRPPDNPLIVHIHEQSQIESLCVNVPDIAYSLWERFSPGPLTLILERHHTVPAIVSAGLDTIALRIPSHPRAQEFLKLAGVPIAAPSANVSGRPSPTDFRMACEYMDGRADYIIDGGPCEIGLESTVVLCREDRLIILRPGKITRDELSAVAGPRIPVYFLEESEERHLAMSSPGTRHPHYKPVAEVRIVSDLIQWKQDIDQEKTLIMGVLALEDQEITHPGIHVLRFSSVDQYAREFYKSLQDLDRQGVDIIYCMPVPDEGVGHALMNRMRRAAGLE